MKATLTDNCVKEGGLYHIYNVLNTKMPTSVQELVQALPGPTVFHIDGLVSKCIVISVLVRGNEPTALGTLLTFLHSKTIPAYSVKLMIIEVEAARRQPLFSRAYLPGTRDLNRCFREPFLYQNMHRAHDIYEFIETLKPDCVIDFHDNPASNNPVAVSAEDSDRHRELASFFCQEMLYFPASSGAMINLPVSCPVISVYLPTDFTPVAQSTFYCQLLRMWQHYPENISGEVISIIPSPKRLELKRNADLAFADKPVFGVSCTLTNELQSFDRKILTPGDVLGWVDHNQLQHFRVIGDQGIEPVETFFSANDNSLKVIRPFRLYLLALHPDIAKSDCLFYFSDV